MGRLSCIHGSLADAMGAFSSARVQERTRFDTDPSTHGKGTIVQAAPFHRSASGRPLGPTEPVAMQLVAETQETFVRWLPVLPAGVGAGVSRDQEDPFQLKITGVDTVGSPETAMQCF